MLHHEWLTQSWRLSGITHISSGFPVTLTNNSDNSLYGTLDNGINNFYVDLPDATGQTLSLSHNPRANGGAYFNAGALSFQTLGTPGDVERRYFYGPGQANFDMALQRSIPVRDAKTLKLRFEAFNIFNHTQFFGPSSVNGMLGASNFGDVISTSPPRICQASARSTF